MPSDGRIAGRTGLRAGTWRANASKTGRRLPPQGAAATKQLAEPGLIRDLLPLAVGTRAEFGRTHGDRQLNRAELHLAVNCEPATHPLNRRRNE
jgi:hypothetical protein